MAGHAFPSSPNAPTHARGILSCQWTCPIRKHLLSAAALRLSSAAAHSRARRFAGADAAKSRRAHHCAQNSAPGCGVPLPSPGSTDGLSASSASSRWSSASAASTPMLLGIGMATLAVFQLKAAERLARLDDRAPALLARNQGILGLLLVLYAAVSLFTFLQDPAALVSSLDNSDPAVYELIAPLHRSCPLAPHRRLYWRDGGGRLGLRPDRPLLLPPAKAHRRAYRTGTHPNGSSPCKAPA